MADQAAKADSRLRLLRRVHACGSKLRMNHDALHDMAQQWYAKSLSDMSQRELEDMAAILARQIGNLKSAQVKKKHTWTAKDKKIFKLGYLLRWDTQDLKGFMQRTVGKRELKQLTDQEKSFLIVGLEKVLDGRK